MVYLEPSLSHVLLSILCLFSEDEVIHIIWLDKKGKILYSRICVNAEAYIHVYIRRVLVCMTLVTNFILNQNNCFH